MIGHGDYHLLVPTDPLENLKFRLSLWEECRKSERARYLVWQACKADILFFINVFGWQTNPDHFEEEDGPFIAFTFQQNAVLLTIQKLWYDRNVVIWEKSRKQGGTILMLFIIAWLTIFYTRKHAIVMSHRKEAVEQSDDEDTLFGKTDFIIKALPSWMQQGLPRVKNVYKMRKTKSQIVGTSTTVRTGIGNRAAIIGADEVSKWNKANEILGQLKATGPILAIGTHYGVGGPWYDLCYNNPAVFKIVFHWSMNPMYNRGLYRSDPGLLPHERMVDPANPPPADYPFVTDGRPHGGPFPGLRSIYYDQLPSSYSEREIACNWDIDPTGAARQFFNIKMLRDYIRKYATDPDWEGEVEHDPMGRFKRLVKKEGGPLRIWGQVLPNAELTGKWLTPSIYKVGCDVSQGAGATPSCLSAIDAMTGKKVLEWQYSLPPEAEPQNFARIATAICHMLSDPAGNPAQLVWDRSGPSGDKFGKTVVDLGFRNFWYWRDEFKLNVKISDTPGWFANPQSILSLFKDYNVALEKGLILNRSESSLLECLAFEYTDGGLGIAHGESLRTDDPAAGRLNHSDMAQADALGWKLCKDVGGDKSPEDRQTAMNSNGWNADGPTYGWLLEQADRESKMTLPLFRR